MAGNVGAGRKVIPIEEKIARGTVEPDREKKRKNNTRISSKKPVAPIWLNKRARQIFNLIVRRMDVKASASHTEIIAKVACREEECQRYTKLLDEQGLYYEIRIPLKKGREYEKDAEGNILYYTRQFPRPEIMMREKAMRQIPALYIELGLTPSSAHRVPMPAAPGSKDGEKDGFEGL